MIMNLNAKLLVLNWKMVRPHHKEEKQERTKEKKYLENYQVGLQKIMLFGTIQKSKLGP